MKVKVISRSADEFTRERSQDLQKVFRNFDPSLHTQARAHEYVRALNAAKLDKIFAKPFLGAMSGHIDAISCMAKNPHHLKGIFSGSMDGDIRLWDIASRRTVQQFPGHRGAVRGLTVSTDGEHLISCGDDCKIVPPTHLRLCGIIPECPQQLSACSIVLLNYQVESGHYEWITRTNAIAWNPREPMNFTAANEDCHCYSYDMRRMKMSTCVHQDHVSAVMDIDYSPTGREFVTGSYDRTVRIFPYNGGHSREIYHTKRMQRVFCVKFSCDATYVLSGSDDTNLRLWKAKASEQLGVLLPRERKKHEYLDAVKERFKHLPEIKRIDRHRHLPKPIYKAANLRRTVNEAEKKRKERKRAHSAPGSVVTAPLRKRRIIAELE